MTWRCVKDGPVGVELTAGPFSPKPVCPVHGTKACVVKRLVHHANGCAQSKLLEPKPGGRGMRKTERPAPYCVEDVRLVTCHNCLRKLGEA